MMNNKKMSESLKYGIPYLIFEYKLIKFDMKHMKSEVGRQLLYIIQH